MAYNGTIVGSPTFAAAKFSTGLTATSDSNYATTPAGLSTVMAALTDATFEMWIKTSSSSVAVAFTTAADSNWFIGITGADTLFDGFSGANAITATGISDGNFHHIASVVDSGVGTTYFDGVSIGTGSSDPNTLFTQAATLIIGRYSAGGVPWLGAIDEIAFWNFAKYTTNFTPPVSPYTGEESGLVALYHLNGNLTDSTVTVDNIIAPNDPGILYSPYNWHTTSGNTIAVNGGAYFRTIFEGTAVALETDTSDNTGYPTFWARIDYGTWTTYTLSAGDPEFVLAAGLDDRKHLLEVVVKDAATATFTTRWTLTDSVNFTGIKLDTGKALFAPTRRTKNVIIYGDSITEGVFTHGTGLNDGLASYGYALGQAIDAEIGLIGFAGQGVTVGFGNVPALPSSYNLIYSGQARTFSPAPDIVIYNEGTNDSTSITAGLVTVANGILAAAPSSKHLILVPFNGTHSSEITAAAASIGASATAQSTSGWFDPADSVDGTHPYDYSHVALIAPELIPVVQGLLNPSSGGSSSRPFIVIQ